MAKKTGPMQGPAPVYKVRDPKAPTGQAKAAQTRAAKAGTAKREAWEATPTGQSRMASPIQPGIHPATVYREQGDHDNSRHPEGQQALPGMSSLAEGRQTGVLSPTGDARTLPDTVPVARWHHLSNGEKMQTEAHAAKFGVTRASAKAAFSANLDQAYANSEGKPHARDFYVDQSHDMPAGHIVQAAKDTGKSVSAVATATTITSPQTEWGPTKDGHYPNIRAARQAALHQGHYPIESPKVADGDSRKVGVFYGNVVKAHGAVQQHDAGALAADLRGDAGNPMFGGPSQQKTTAFRNALVDPEGPQSSFVSDVHSGGRGMAPHLSPEEAGTYLKHPGIHQWHDHIAREVMNERGMQSINNTQAAQWGQAQLDSGAVNAPKAAAAEQVSGQQSLFGDHPAAAHLAAAHEQEPWTAGHQARSDATIAKRRREGKSFTPDPKAVAEGW